MRIFFKGLLLLVVLSNIMCANNLGNKLQGEWICIDDMDCPDFIFFHKSGRYVTMNDCGSAYPCIPIVEKGDWLCTNQGLILKNREFVAQFSDFRNHHGKDLLLSFKVNFNQKSGELELNQDKGKYIERYRRIYNFPKITEVCSGFESKVKKIVLPSSGARTLLKLSYKFFHWSTKECPVALIIEDQEQHLLFRKVLTFTEDIKKEELLLADIPEVNNLKELIFKINPQKSGRWDLMIKLC